MRLALLELDTWYADGAQTNLALRADDIDRILLRWATVEPVHSVVELGGGLSTRPFRLEELDASWVFVDLPEVVGLRKAWAAPGRHLAASVLEKTWMTDLGSGPHVFIAEGLLYYLPQSGVHDLFGALGAKFPGSTVIMDVLSEPDYPKLYDYTAALGTPIQWYYDGDLDRATEAYGLRPEPNFSAHRLTKEALIRYFARLEPQLKAMSWWALNADQFLPRRSGNILGRLSG